MLSFVYDQRPEKSTESRQFGAVGLSRPSVNETTKPASSLRVPQQRRERAFRDQGRAGEAVGEALRA